MLLPEMTTGTRQAILATLAFSQAHNVPIDARQTLFGLLHEEEGRPSQLFRDQGVSLDELRASLNLPATDFPLPEELPPYVDAFLQGLLYDARIHALELTGSPNVSTEHLLLTLLEQHPDLRESLLAQRFSFEKLRQSLSQELGPPLQLDEPLQLIDTPEQMSLARILDANANRAREALRILEEAARFQVNDRFLTRLAKELRHELTQAFIHHLPTLVLILSRDTTADVGTENTTNSEAFRGSIQAVLQANAQRLQEALRVLEEYGKIQSPELGAAIKQIRYRAYTLERALILGDQARQRLAHANLYLLVSKGSCAASVEWTIREAVAGGVDIVQLREKHKTDRELLTIAQEVRQVTREVGALFIMNDRPDLARLAQADGVHLGQDDLTIHAARQILGPDALIGVSTHDPKQLELAILDGADYVGVGPTFSSHTKDFSTLSGLEFVKQASTITTLPAFAIGGITADNISQIVDAGLRRVAIGHAFCQADEPREMARRIKAHLIPIGIEDISLRLSEATPQD